MKHLKCKCLIFGALLSVVSSLYGGDWNGYISQASQNMDNGQYSQALSELDLAFDAAKSQRTNSLALAYVYQAYAELAAIQKQKRAAVELQKRAVHEFRTSNYTNNIEYADSLFALATYIGRTWDYKLAAKTASQATRIYEDIYGSEDIRTAYALYRLVFDFDNIAHNEKRLLKNIPRIISVLEKNRKSSNAAKSMLSNCYLTLGLLLSKQGHLDDAIENMETGLRLYDTNSACSEMIYNSWREQLLEIKEKSENIDGDRGRHRHDIELQNKL